MFYKFLVSLVLKRKISGNLGIPLNTLSTILLDGNKITHAVTKIILIYKKITWNKK